MTVITTSTAATATAYSNQRKVDRTSNGVLWTFHTVAPVGFNGIRGYFHYSTDDGSTWSAGQAFEAGTWGTSYTPNASFFIDQDDYAHVVWKEAYDGFIYYRRGTPNAARTAWTWSGATTVAGFSNRNHYDLIAHREGTGWAVHIVGSLTENSQAKAFYTRLSITSAGVVSVAAAESTISATLGAANANSGFPSIDFHHTGDGKTIKDGTPHLYVAWSAGAAGANYGIRFKKATYSAGAWTWGTEREIDSTRHLASGIDTWMTCLFDGTRIVVTGLFAPFAYDLALYERDAADTTTDTRVLVTDADSTTYLISSSAAYDADGNIYIVGVDRSGADGTNKLNYRMWDRQALALGPIVTVDSSARNFPYVSAKRGYSGGKIEFIYTDGTASPYAVTYDAIVLNELPLAPTVTDVDWENGQLAVTYDHNDPDGDAQAKRQFRYRKAVV